MTHLTSEQIIDITDRVIERFAEFGGAAQSLPRMTPGAIRIIVDVIDEWRAERVPVVNMNGNGKHNDPEPAEYEAYDDPHEELVQWRPAATLGPEYTMVTPLKPKPPEADVAREKIAVALANGSDGELAALVNRAQRAPARTLGDVDKRSRQQVGHNGNVLPTREQVIKAVQEMAMGGVMPSQNTFNESKPANWATASAHLQRLNMSWNDLAVAAELTPTRVQVQ